MNASKLAALGAFLALAGLARGASAQAWLSDRALTEGKGVRVGNTELHPGVGAEFGYDSNYFQRAGEDAGSRANAGLPPAQLAVLRGATAERERIVPALRLRITPHLALSTLGPRRSQIETGAAAPPDLTFRAQTTLRYNEFFPITDDDVDVRGQRNLAGEIGGALDIKPYDPFGADLEAGFLRTVEPSNTPDTSNAFDRFTVIGGGGISWRPGGGLFRWRLGYGAQATIFEDDAFGNLGNVHHQITSTGRWLFLPRTALLSQSTLGLIRYGTNVSQNSGDYIRTLLGINGLITYHFGFLALAGWGATFYEPIVVVAENFDSVIGQVELAWYPTPQEGLPQSTVGVSAVAGGYTRDFANSYLADYYQRDRFYGRVSYMFGGGVFLISGSAGYSLVTHPNIHFPASDPRNAGQPIPGFVENRIDASLFLEYRLSDSFGLNTTFMYDASLTAQQIQNSATDPSQGLDELGFSRFQGYVGARWFL
jgi:hypothetical protein